MNGSNLVTPIEEMISILAGRWIDLRQRARDQGGGPLYWLFGLFGLLLMAQIAAKITERHFSLIFPWDFVVPWTFALIWIRTSFYRLRPFRMFGVTMFVLVALAELRWISA